MADVFRCRTYATGATPAFASGHDASGTPRKRTRHTTHPYHRERGQGIVNIHAHKFKSVVLSGLCFFFFFFLPVSMLSACTGCWPRWLVVSGKDCSAVRSFFCSTSPPLATKLGVLTVPFVNDCWLSSKKKNRRAFSRFPDCCSSKALIPSPDETLCSSLVF